MPSIQSVGGKSVVIPDLDMDIGTSEPLARAKAESNWTELQAAYAMAGRSDDLFVEPLGEDFSGNNGTVLLPAGTIKATGPNGTSLSNIMIDERHASITIQGAGRAKTLIVDPYRSVPQIQINSRRVSNSVNHDFDTTHISFTGITAGAMDGFEVGDLAYFWTFNNTKARTVLRDIRTITAVDPDAGTLSIDSLLTRTADNVRSVKGVKVAGAVAAGSEYVTLDDSDDLDLFHVNDDVLIGDGPALNEFFCEWATVMDLDHDNGRVYFTPPLRQSYAENYTCIVPPPHLTDVTLRDLAIAAPINSDIRYMGYIRIGRRIRLESVDFVPDGDDFVAATHGPLDVSGCGEIAIVHCSIFGPSFSVCHDGFLHDIRARGFGFQEYCFDFDCSSITIDGGNFLCQDADGFGPCQRIHLRDFLALKYCKDEIDPGIRLAEGSRITNVRLTNAQNDETIYINDDDMVLESIESDKDVWIGGTNVWIGRFSATKFSLRGAAGAFPASSGVLLGPIDTPEMVDSAPVGNWHQPLMLDHDGNATPWQSSDGYTARKPGVQLPSADKDTVPLTVQGAADQEVSLQQWKNSSGTVVIAVLSDGNIGTSKATSGSTLGTVVKKLPIKDASGTLLDYLPIYDSIT